jgi:hypothetical protein
MSTSFRPSAIWVDTITSSASSGPQTEAGPRARRTSPFPRRVDLALHHRVERAYRLREVLLKDGQVAVEAIVAADDVGQRRVVQQLPRLADGRDGRASCRALGRNRRRRAM